MPLDPVAQQLDFSLGMFRSGALEREPDGAAEQILGLLGDDGLPYKRGGSTYRSNAALGSAGLLWVASLILPVGERTLFGSASAVDVLGLDDATPGAVPASPGGSPYTIAAPSGPFRPVSVGGWVPLWGAGPNSIHWWAGSRRASGTGYSTGVVDVTHGSKTLVGTATSWLANVEAGDTISSAGVQNVVASVESNTSLTVVEAWLGPTTVGPGYSVAGSLISIPPLLPAVYGSRIQASVANRWVVASGKTVYFTPAVEPPLYVVEFQDDDFHTFAGDVRGLGVLRDVLLVFTSAGVHAVSGMAYPLVDPATGDPLQRNELVNQDLIAWGHEGIAPWGGSLVIPALDNVYLADNLGAPTPIGDRILDLYLSYVQAGYVPGVAEVYNGHYFLPILNPASSYAWVDTLVSRLKPAHSGNTFAWTQLAGSGAEVAAFTERQTVPPLLLAASRRSTSRVLDDSAFFKPVAGVKNDADGTVPSFQLTTIDYPTGNMVSNFVHHVRLMYGLTDAASDNPTITAEVSVDGGAFTALAGTAPEAQPGEKKWRVNQHAKNVRFRFTVAAASALCWVKSVEVFVRHSGKQ